MLTEQLFATTAVETFSAELGIIGTDSLSDLEAFYALAHSCNNAHGLVPGDEREPRQKLAFVDVQVGTADTAGFDFDEDIVVSQFGEVDLYDAVFLWLGVPVRGDILVTQDRTREELEHHDPLEETLSNERWGFFLFEDDQAGYPIGPRWRQT